VGTAAGADPGRDDLVRTCLDHINHERYQAVPSCVQRLRERFPDSPAAPFIAATAYQTMMSDYRVRRFEREFEGEIADAISRAKAAARTGTNAEGQFLWGAAESYRCLHWFRQGKWLKALRAALNSTKRLEEAHRMEPQFVDPLFGLALFDHARHKVRVLGLGLFRDRSRRAIERLTLARDKARFVSVNALYALQYVHVDRGDHALALPVNDALFAQFPRNPVCLYNRGLILEALGRAAEAVPVWSTLVEVIGAFSQPSEGFLAECHYHLALLARRRGDQESASRFLSQAKAHAARRIATQELDGPYFSFKDIQRAIGEALRGAG
jgi:tetratricopeptide (TPR) repeat protein